MEFAFNLCRDKEEITRNRFQTPVPRFSPDFFYHSPLCLKPSVFNTHSAQPLPTIHFRVSAWRWVEEFCPQKDTESAGYS